MLSRTMADSVPNPHAGARPVAAPSAPPAGFPEERRFRLSVLVPVYNERHLVAESLRRLLALHHPLVESLEVIVVDDRSTDGSWEVLQRLADTDPRIRLLRHERNEGKGAAVRTALSHATGDVCVIHDADLEYYPDDIGALLVPFAEEGADAVYGSRYLSARYRRALMYRHTLINRTVTTLANWFTNLDLTDVETCYKAVNTTLLKSIPLRSRDFRLEIELTFKLAKRRARIFEVPIRYHPRTYEEGKKIGLKDGFLALQAILHWSLIDDVFQADEYGSHILLEMERARRFNIWMAETLRPYVRDRVLEAGAGIGTLTNQYIPRERYLASDVNEHYLHYLRSYSIGKPYLEVRRIDLTRAADFEGLEGQFDTVLLVNVLEHVADEHAALTNIRAALEPGGRAVVLVPQHPGLYGSLDTALEHRERYTVARLRAALEAAGLEVERIHEFNRFSVPGWWWNGRVLRRRTYSRFQLKLLEILMPLVRRIDRFLPWPGLSLVAVATRAPDR